MHKLVGPRPHFRSLEVLISTYKSWSSAHLVMKPVYVPITIYGTPVTSDFAGKNNARPDSPSVLVFRLAELRVYGVAIGASCRIVSAVSLSYAGDGDLCSLAAAQPSPTDRRACPAQLSTERRIASRIPGAPAPGGCISAAFGPCRSTSRRSTTALRRRIEAAASRRSIGPC